jgi:gluconolactonase
MRSDANRKQLKLPTWAMRQLQTLMLVASIIGCGDDKSASHEMPAGSSVQPAANSAQPSTNNASPSATTGVQSAGATSSGSAPGTAGKVATSGSAGASGSGDSSDKSTPSDDVVKTGASSGQGGASAAAAGTSAATAGAGASSDVDPSLTMTYPPLDPNAIGMPMQVANGFRLAESPLWDPCNKQLLFSDVSAPGGGVINALGSDGMVKPFMTDTGNTNGFAWDLDGSLILTQMKGHVARRDRAGMVTVLDSSDVTLHTPDDVVVRSDGTIYFSDGNFCPVGDLLGYSTALPVFTIKPNTTTLINSGTVRGPNGIRLSPDEKLLYVDGYGDGNIYRFDVMPDGSIKKQMTPFATGLTDPDSMCIDVAGNLYVAVSTGLQIFSPDGTKIKLIRMSAPGGSCTKAGMTNCGFGGDDGKTLYITSWTTLFKIDNMPIPGLDWVMGKKRAQCM